MEHGHSKLVMQEIVKLPTVKGRNYDKICELYEALCKNCDALRTLGEDIRLKGLAVSIFNKLPVVKPDLVSSGDDWEDRNMNQLLFTLWKWLKRNKVEETNHGPEYDGPKRTKLIHTKAGGGTHPTTMGESRVLFVFIVRENTRVTVF